VLPFEAAIATARSTKHTLTSLARGSACVLIAYHSKACRVGLAHIDDRNLGLPVPVAGAAETFHHPYRGDTDLEPLKKNVRNFLRQAVFANLPKEDLKKQYVTITLLCGGADLTIALGEVLTKLQYDSMTLVDWRTFGAQRTPDNVAVSAKDGRLLTFDTERNKIIETLFGNDVERIRAWAAYSDQIKAKNKDIADGAYHHDNQETFHFL